MSMDSRAKPLATKEQLQTMLQFVYDEYGSDPEALPVMQELAGRIKAFDTAPQTGMGDLRIRDQEPHQPASTSGLEALQAGYSMGLGSEIEGAVEATLHRPDAGNDPSWFARQRMGSDRAEAELAQSRAERPLAHKIIEPMAAIASFTHGPGRFLPGFSKAASKVAPYASRGGQFLTRSLAALADKKLYDAVLAALPNWDRPEDALAAAAASQGLSKWDFASIGMANMPQTIDWSLQKASDLAATHANWQALKTLRPGTKDIRLIKQEYGTAERGGEALKNAKLADGRYVIEMGDSPQDIAAKFVLYRNEAGGRLGQAEDAIEATGGRVNEQNVLHQIDNGPLTKIKDVKGYKTNFPGKQGDALKFRADLEEEMVTPPSGPSTFKEWAGFSSQLGDSVRLSANQSIRPNEMIAKDPLLRMKNQTHGILIENLEDAAAATPVGRTPYQAAKQEVATAKTFQPAAQRAADEADTPFRNRDLDYFKRLAIYRGAPFLLATGLGIGSGGSLPVSLAAGGAYQWYANKYPFKTRFWDGISKKLAPAPNMGRPLDPALAAWLAAYGQQEETP
jgi:hypothetical protein